MRKAREICFVFIYLIEQLCLILLSSFQTEYLNLWISIFPVVFLSTMAIEKNLLTAKYEEEMGKLLERKEPEKRLNKDFKEFRTDYFKRFK